ncbi:hypothetical protein WA158_001998 [Blastocystis sp. Blastoise]
MKFQYLLFLFCVALCLDESISSKMIIEMSPEDVKSNITETSETNYIIVFEADNCGECKHHIFYPLKAVFAYEDYDDIKVVNVKSSENPDLVEFCDVDIESNDLEIRLITSHKEKCVFIKSQSIIYDLKQQLKRETKENYLVLYNSTIQTDYINTKSKNVIMSIVDINYYTSMYFDNEMERVAYAFRYEPDFLFVRFFCHPSISICEPFYKDTVKIPSLRVFPKEGVNSTQQLLFPYLTKEGVMEQLNAYFDTSIQVDGYLDDWFGRDLEFERLYVSKFLSAKKADAASMIETIDPKLYKNGDIYLHIMKKRSEKRIYISNKKEEIKGKLQNLHPQDKSYRSMKALYNILNSFILPTHAKSLELTPFNIYPEFMWDVSFPAAIYIAKTGGTKCDDIIELAITKGSDARHDNTHIYWIEYDRMSKFRYLFNSFDVDSWIFFTSTSRTPADCEITTTYSPSALNTQINKCLAKLENSSFEPTEVNSPSEYTFTVGSDEL